MPSILWMIDTDKALDKKLARFGSNSDVAKGYRTAVADLAQAADPAGMGERKRGPLRHLHSYRITRSYRLLYRVDRRRNTIVLVDMDDHKNLYGRD